MRAGLRHLLSWPTARQRQAFDRLRSYSDTASKTPVADAGAEAEFSSYTSPNRASFWQERPWFMNQSVPGSAAYNVTFELSFNGPLDRARFKAAYNALQQRHKILRAVLSFEDGHVRQSVELAADYEVPFPDLHNVSDVAQQADAKAHSVARQGIALDRFPLFNAVLIAQSDEVQRLVWVASHAIADGGALRVLIDDLDPFYRAAKTGGELAILPP